MKAAYLRSIEAATIVDDQEIATTAERSIRHLVLIPKLDQLVTLTMSDHRPGSREAMLKLHV